MPRQPPQPNPYKANIITFKEITSFYLQMEFSGTGKPIKMKELEKEYADGLFRRIPYSERHTLLRLGDGTTIGIVPCIELKTDERL
jgi:hypothetical protein